MEEERTMTLQDITAARQAGARLEAVVTGGLRSGGHQRAAVGEGRWHRGSGLREVGPVGQGVTRRDRLRGQPGSLAVPPSRCCDAARSGNSDTRGS
jgi:hypothetical protein